jgi:hypothetical protein
MSGAKRTLRVVPTACRKIYYPAVGGLLPVFSGEIRANSLSASPAGISPLMHSETLRPPSGFAVGPLMCCCPQSAP